MNHKYTSRPKELYSWPHWKAQQSRAKEPHPVEVGLASAAGCSLLTIVICVIIQVFQSFQSEVDYQDVEKVLDVLWWSLIVLGLSTGLYLVWNRFVRHG